MRIQQCIIINSRRIIANCQHSLTNCHHILTNCHHIMTKEQHKLRSEHPPNNKSTTHKPSSHVEAVIAFHINLVVVIKLFFQTAK